MALPLSSSFQSRSFHFLPNFPIATPPSATCQALSSIPQHLFQRRRLSSSILPCRSSDDGNEDYLLDAPVSVGDGFSFSGGKYSDEPSPADEWFKKGRIVKAHQVGGTGEKARDPIFGLTMGSSSQASSDLFRT